MNPDCKKSSEGFSLVELLVYIAIFSVVSASIWQAFIWFQRNHINFTGQQQISFDIDYLYDLLNKDISISSPNDLPNSNTNCLHISGLKTTYSFERGNLYRYSDENGVCPVSNNSLKPMLDKNIISDSSDTVNFFVIGPLILDLQGNPILDLQGNPILDPNSKYKTITYSFHVQLDNKTTCCNTIRQVFSVFSQ